MTEFFINFKKFPELPEWNELVLPDDYEFTETEENPEITSFGSYTLDITVSLLEARNAIAFRFINRENNSDIKQTADARKIENGIVTSGTIEIQKNSDVDVTFQFLSGNSELNYIAKNEKKIWELDWGVENEITFELASRSINYPAYGVYENIPIPPFYFHTSWVQNYVCAPVKLGSEVVNDYTLENGVGTAQENGGIANMFKINGISGKIVMQPYLLYYVNKLPELLGYTLEHNVLDTNERAKIMYLVNAVGSLNYADALPDMTISEFIDAIEQFFNVSFLVNASQKSISIESLSSNLANKKTVTVSNVLDGYERDMSTELESIRLDFTKVSYDLSDSLYFKYQKLNDDILAKCTIMSFNSLTEIVSCVSATDYSNKLVIFRDTSTLNDYFIGVPGINLYSRYSAYMGLKLINKFRSTSGSNDKELKLALCPSAVVKKSKQQSWYMNGGTTFFDVYYQVPESSNNYSVAKELGFVASVEKGLSNITRNSRLEVALYAGLIRLHNENSYGITVTTPYPFSYIDYLPEFGILEGNTGWTNFETWKNTYYKPKASLTMRLNGEGSIIEDYHQASIIDTSKEYTFIIIDEPDIKASNIFIINNLKYMPISFERRKSNKSTTVLGKFYRMLV